MSELDELLELHRRSKAAPAPSRKREDAGAVSRRQLELIEQLEQQEAERETRAKVREVESAARPTSEALGEIGRAGARGLYNLGKFALDAGRGMEGGLMMLPGLEETREFEEQTLEPVEKAIERRSPRGSPGYEAALTAAEVGVPTLVGGAPSLLSKPLQALPPIVGSIAGAAGASALATAQDASPGQKAAMELFGEIGGGLTPIALERIGRAAKRLITAAVKGPDESLLNDDAIRDIYATLRDELGSEGANAVINNIREGVRHGDVEGTLAFWADTNRMRGLQHVIATRTKRGAEFATIDAATSGGLLSRAVGTVPGDPEDIRRVADKAVSETLQNIGERGATEQRLNRLIGERALARESGRLEKARAAQQQAGVVDVPTEDTGALVGARAAEALENARGREELAWARVPMTETLDASVVKRQIDGYLNSIDPIDRKGFIKDNPEVMELLGELKPDMPVRSMISIKNRISRLISNAAKQGRGGDYDDAINTHIANAVKEAVDAHPSGGAAYEAARAQTNETFDIFRSRGTPMKAALGRGDKATAGRALLVAREGGPLGVRQAKEAGEEMFESLVEYTRSRFGEAFASSPAKARTFLETYRPALNEMERLGSNIHKELMQKYTTGSRAAATVPEATRAAKMAESATATRASRLAASQAAKEAAARKGTVAGFATQASEFPVERAHKVLMSQTPSSQIAELKKVAAADGPEAVQNLSATFARAGLREIMPDPSTGRVVNSAQQLLETRGAALRSALGDNFDDFRNAIEPFDRLRGQPLMEVTEIDDHMSLFRRGMIALARLTGAKIAGVTTGQPLLASNMSSSAVKRYLVDEPQKKYENMLANYMLHPERFIEDFDRLATEGVKATEALDIVERLTGPAAGVAATTEPTRKKPTSGVATMREWILED